MKMVTIRQPRRFVFVVLLLFFILILVWVAPIWKFNPLVINRSAEEVGVPMPANREYAICLKAILDSVDEPNLRIGNLMFVRFSLYKDADARSKYTVQADVAATLLFSGDGYVSSWKDLSFDVNDYIRERSTVPISSPSSPKTNTDEKATKVRIGTGN